MSEEKSQAVVVPYEKLSEEALMGLINEFILREGTDYGAYEFTLEQKHNHIFKQLKSGQIAVVFDLSSQTPSLIRKEDLSKI